MGVRRFIAGALEQVGVLSLTCKREIHGTRCLEPLVVTFALLITLPPPAVSGPPDQATENGESADTIRAKSQAAKPLTTAAVPPPAQQQAAKPAISKETVSSGRPGAQITLKGTGFAPTVSGNTVKFGETTASVKSATPTAIVTTVPANLKVGKTSLTVSTSEGTSDGWPFNVLAEPVKSKAPVITKLSPSSGSPGSEVTITGTGFGAKKGTVKFNEFVATVSGDGWAETTLTVVVPKGLTPGNTTVTATTSAGESKGVLFTVVAPVIWYGVVWGDFSPFINAGNLVPIHINILSHDFQVIGEATSSSLSPTDSTKLPIFYTQSDPKIVPEYVLIGKTSPGDHQYPFAPIARPAGTNPSTVTYQQVIAGDFCLPAKAVPPAPRGQCTTGLLTVDAYGNLVTPPSPLPDRIEGYVQTADGASQKATVKSIGLDSVDLSFTAAAGFKPAWLVLEGNSGARRFVYTPAPPVQDSDLIYTSDDMETICNLNANNERDCINTAPSDLVLKPVASNSAAVFVAVQKRLLVAHIRAPLGSEPTAIMVTNTKNNPNTSAIVRRTIKPGANTDLLNVDLTIMDQVTAQRNYGNRIAKRYIAVTLDVKNPTSKKVQFNKSAMYFDVDYVEAKERGDGFVESVKMVSTLGLWQPSVYKPPFVAAHNETPEEKKEPKENGKQSKKNRPPRLARFGLEQNVKHSPENYLSVLASFDYTTQKTDDKLKAQELFGSVLSNIATGGLVADASGAFRAGTSVFSGTFLPGVRGLVLDTSFINRLRTNLVSQTLQETIQVPANGSTSTIVLLPRTGILSFIDAEVPVMVDRVIDVHLIPEVVSEVTSTPVTKGSCKVGYTKEQARDALGEPAGVTTNADGTSVFTYPTGPATSASFSGGGSLVSCQQRSPSDQLAQAATLADMNQTLTGLNLTADKVTITDGSTVLTDIPGVQQSYHFDAKGNKTTDYTFLFPKIKAFENQPKSALDSFLEAQAKTLLAARSDQITMEATKADTDKTTTAIYDSPDVQNGKIVITFDNKPGTAPKGSNIKAISFTGDKPQGVN